MKIPGLFQIMVIALIILVLFGRGRISAVMGDFGKGIKGFKKGLDDDETAAGQAAAGRIDRASHDVHPVADKTAG